jgi:hypothetical protein
METRQVVQPNRRNYLQIVPAGRRRGCQGTSKQRAAEKPQTNPNVVFRRHPVYQGHDWDMLQWINYVEGIA